MYVNGISCIVSNNSISKMRSTGVLEGIAVASGGAIISNNVIYDLSSSDVGNTVYGIRVAADNVSIANNRFEQVKNSGVAAQAIGIYIQSGISVKLDSNYCYNNGSDTGIANTNSNNFSDAGTDTQVYSNSWQSPVSGEPTLGELHLLSTVPSVSWYFSSLSTTVISSVTNSYVPVGTKAIEMFVVVSADYQFVMASKYTGCTCTGAYINMAGYNDNVGDTTGYRVPIPVDSGRKFYFRSWNRGAGCGGVTGQAYFVPVGYYC
jgi:hypothetical protein